MRLAHIMRDRGFTQKQVADRVELNQGTVSRIASGKWAPSPRVARRLLKLFPELTWADLYGPERPPRQARRKQARRAA